MSAVGGKQTSLQRSHQTEFYLSIDFMQPVLDSSFHVFLPVGESERDAVSSWDDGHHLSICTLPDEGIQRNHLKHKPTELLVQKLLNYFKSGLAFL